MLEKGITQRVALSNLTVLTIVRVQICSGHRAPGKSRRKLALLCLLPTLPELKHISPQSASAKRQQRTANSSDPRNSTNDGHYIGSV
ncbi:MAG: hypothetical protein CMJ81_18945 [Planctomycetaceae bacterium]|nr:hypothetical protein [Planctomycetaceae bacterium]MBP61426.1 hypothetical protein [Planctomycetaceae bacterium]